MTPTSQAATIANLSRMGYPADHSRYISEQWTNYQRAFSLHSLASIGSIDLPVYDAGLPDDVGGQFFMSCHYGSYPHVVHAIARRAKDRTIYVLIGSESDSLKTILHQRARETNIAIQFIDGGFGMLRQLKRALADGYPVFVEIDVPWGQTHECNVSFPFIGGEIKAKDALFRMIDRLAVPKHFILSMVGEQSIIITNYGDLNQEKCFAVFADAVRNSPQQYERLFQMHMYFEPAQPSDVAIVWQGKTGRYMLHAHDMKAWSLPVTDETNVSLKDCIQSVIGRKVSHVVSL